MALPPALSGPWNPRRVTGTPIPPGLLLMAKIMALALLATGHVRILPEPFLPFIDGLDRLIAPMAFRLTLQTVVIVAALALLFNRCVRASAIVLGSCLLVAVVSSRAYYGNNKTFVGLAFVLAGLSDFDRLSLLLRWQMMLVYFGAALNKLLDPDWQSGLFFEYWAGQKLRNPLFLAVTELLPPLVAGKAMCWGSIVVEFIAAAGYAVPRSLWLAMTLNVAFQVCLLEFTGTTFTLFFYGMVATTFAFVAWPERLQVGYDPARTSHRWARRVLRLFDADGLQDWQPSPGGRLTVDDRGRINAGIGVIPRLLLYSPTFWLTATVLLALPDGLRAFPIDAAAWRRALVVGMLLFFMPLLRSPRAGSVATGRPQCPRVASTPARPAVAVVPNNRDASASRRRRNELTK